MKGKEMTMWQGLNDNVSLYPISIRESLIMGRIGRV